jgi:hypothetical protein
MVVVGASNIQYYRPSSIYPLRAIMFGDLIKIGWITSKPNIEKVTQDRLKLDADTCDTVVILDLFSNSVYRYRQTSVMKPCLPL